MKTVRQILVEAGVHPEDIPQTIIADDVMPISVRYGCHCDLEPHMKPDGCVIDSGDIYDCIHAGRLTNAGKGRNECEYWQPIRIV